MKTKNTILLVIAFAFICSAVKAGEYHDDDKTALRNFLIQNSYGEYQTNGQRLGLDDDDMAILNGIDWLTEESWVGKISGFTWNSKNPKRLTEINWDFRSLAGNLDLTGCASLDALSCFGNQLTSLDVSKNTALQKLDCAGNHLTSLDVSKNVALTRLHCAINQLTNLDVSKNIRLERLFCGHIQLANLDLLNNIKLEELDCTGNHLTNLDISNNTKLIYLECPDNQLKFSTLPLPKEQYLYYVYSPQDTIRGGTVAYSSGIDLSSEYSIDGNITNFAWYDVTGGAETSITLASNNGIFSLDASYSGKTLICKMTNETFPNFVDEPPYYSPLIYKVTITDDVSIDDDYENLFINLYPNPSNSILTISNIDNKIFKSISLFDMSGKLLAAYNNIDNSIYSIDISAYPNGTYMLDIDGEAVRFMKQ